MLLWMFSRKAASGFSWASTADQVTAGLSASGLTAIVTGLLERDIFDLFLPEFDKPWVIHLRENCCCSTNICTWRPNNVYKNRSVRRHQASSGIGAETARVLGARGAHVVMAARNLAAAESVRQAILADTPGATLDLMELDLSSMASVRKFAADFTAKGLPLNILVNNAGVMASPFSLSKDGIEMQFATNHVGHFLLTHLLLETMTKTSRESNVEGRIVNVSSEAHKLTYQEGNRFDKINYESEYAPFGAYGQSKLANILHANELAKRLKEGGVNITANSLHPGAIITNLLRHHSVLDVLHRTVGKLVLKNAKQGAATTCYVALHPDVKGVSGKYFSDSNVYEPDKKAKDTELAKKLWDLSVELTT